ncbi:nucleotidyltransferase family protein [Novosphingobium sp.]|uniref:nucleotidyltransferase family protein n=1 Tax=Novosphingobium sp. TaxID=1874826 RepID=UPI002FDE36CE
MSLALTPAERAAVTAILARHLPSGVRVDVFGSRATGTAKPWSDLDLVLCADGPLSLDLMACLAEAFDESALPWKVDLVDRATVDQRFGAIIDAGKVPLWP